MTGCPRAPGVFCDLLTSCEGRGRPGLRLRGDGTLWILAAHARGVSPPAGPGCLLQKQGTSITAWRRKGEFIKFFNPAPEKLHASK